MRERSTKVTRASLGPQFSTHDCLLAEKIVKRPTASLRPYQNNPRVHPDQQIEALARSISKFGWIRPIGVDEFGTILFGHGCWEAAKRLNLKNVPTLTLVGLSEAKKRALVIADNRLAEKSRWDEKLLKLNFQELLLLECDIELTGFSAGEIDIIAGSNAAEGDLTDHVADELIQGSPVSRPGDLWCLSHHSLICSDATSAASYHAIMTGGLAQMVLTDPPYNVKIHGHARGRGRRKHREFAMASGEMSDAQFIGFLENVMRRAIEFSSNGSIHYWFMDWRHLPHLLRASIPLYTEWKNLLVWCKSNAGQGSFYRSQHELITVFKSGTGPHINNFGLGGDGRYRTNVLQYPGGPSPNATRREERDMHPTVKPVALVADLIRDCSKRNGFILDLFGGSGTTLLAAETTGRCACVIEIDPLYVDLTIRRWQQMTGKQAVHVESGKLFDVIATERDQAHD